jgi:hypothetical protein
MAMEQQFRVIGPHAWGAGTTATTMGTTADWAHANFATGAGILTFPAFTAMRLRGLAILPVVVATTAPIFTVKVNRSTDATGSVTTNARTVGTATVLTSITAGDCYYTWFDDDDVLVNPGEQVVVLITTAGGATSTGWVAAIVSDFLVGPTSGGSATVPIVRAKPYGTAGVGSIKITSSSSSGN